MPKLTYRGPVPQRGPLSARERALVEIMLALVNDVRVELGLAPRTEDEALALVTTEKETQA